MPQEQARAEHSGMQTGSKKHGEIDSHFWPNTWSGHSHFHPLFPSERGILEQTPSFWQVFGLKNDFSRKIFFWFIRTCKLSRIKGHNTRFCKGIQMFRNYFRIDHHFYKDLSRIRRYLQNKMIHGNRDNIDNDMFLAYWYILNLFLNNFN